MDEARVGSDFPSPSPGGAGPPPTGVLRSDFSPATVHVAAEAALTQRVRSEVRDVRTEEVGGWRRQGGQTRWTRTDTAITALLIWCSLHAKHSAY